MGKNFSSNPRKKSFIDALPQDSIETSDIASKCKFNFSYLDRNQVGQTFLDLNNNAGNSKLVKLMEKLYGFTKQPLSYWKDQKVGKGKRGGKGKRQSCLEVYGNFPEKSEYTHPRHVPHDVLWARFRLDNEARLVGFIVPDELAHRSDHAGYQYDTNTFYVVFLDENHQFYLK